MRLYLASRVSTLPLYQEWNHGSTSCGHTNSSKRIDFILYLSLSIYIYSGIYHCKENISSGLDINQFVSNSDPDLYGRRPSLATLPDKEATPSPILARKATVIEEWSNLQRTRALSHSKNTSDELCDISPLDPLPLSSATPTKPSPLLNRTSPRPTNRNGQTSSSLLSQRSAPSGEEGNDGGMSKKLLTTRLVGGVDDSVDEVVHELSCCWWYCWCVVSNIWWMVLGRKLM